MENAFRIGCSECFAQTGRLKRPAGKTVQCLYESSHYDWAVMRCNTCSMPMLYYFYELVDWEDGNDEIYVFWSPLSEQEVRFLAERYPDGWKCQDSLPFQLLDREPRLVQLPNWEVVIDRNKVIPGEPLFMMKKHSGYNLIAKMFGKPAEELCGLYVVSDAILEVTLDSEGEFVVKDQASGTDRNAWETFQYGRKLDEPGQRVH